MAGSTLLRWGIQSWVPKLVLRRAAKAGQIGAQLAIDPAMWEDPYPVYEQMRAQGVINRGALVSGTVSHAAVSEVLRSPDFRVDMGSSKRLPAPVRRMIAAAADPWAIGPVEPPSMLAVDPPDHTRYRRLVSKVFTARAVAALEGRIAEIAERLLDDMAGRSGPVDLVEAYAGPLPVQVIAEILGVPAEMQPHMLEWGNAAAVTLEPVMTYRQFRTASVALRSIHHWLADHLKQLQREPGPDLLSQLAGLVDDGDTLTDVELRATALLVIGAGFETTVNLIGNGVALLLEHPEQLAMLREDPSLWPNAVEEILRFEPPVQATGRLAAEAVEVCGERVPAWTFVVTMLAGANRDPAVFADPHRFDITRSNARDHVAFSAGIHFCLGASLARLEGALALRMLFERFPDLEVAGPLVRRRMRVLRGYDRFPIALSPAREPAAA
jgi:cytochrome P450